MLADRLNYPLLGQILEKRYQIVQILTSGAFGQTYIARDLNSPGQPQCVVKYRCVVGDYPSLLKTTRRLFLKEVSILEKLTGYEQVPQLLAAFEDDTGFYLIQELVVGQTIDAYLPLSDYCGSWGCDGQVLNLLSDLLGILDFIHTKGIIHGDLKPNNIIRRAVDGKLVLIDFGGAQLTNGHWEESSFASTIAVSPLGYLAPELLVGKPQPSSDLYALGMVAIQALTGLDPAKLQFNLETEEVSWRHLCKDKAIEVGFSNQLADIIDKMIRYDSQSRYQTAAEVLEAIRPLKDFELPQFVIFPGDQRDTQLLITEEAVLQETLFHEPLVASEPEPTTEKLAWTDLVDNSIQLLESGFLNIFRLFPLVTSFSLGLAGINALALAFGVNYLFNTDIADSGVDTLWSAEQEYKNGNLSEAIALAKSVDEESEVYEQSQTNIELWREEWQVAEEKFTQVEEAFADQKWQRVLQEAAEIPPVPYWQSKLIPLVEKATAKVETEAEELLQKAFTEARNQNFTIAISYLEEIPPETSIGKKVKPKLVEYREKQQIRADYLLQQAYNRAEKGQFLAAIHFLEQIPVNTEVGTRAEEKIAEYVEKERIRRQVEQQQGLEESELNPGNELREVNPTQLLFQ